MSDSEDNNQPPRSPLNRLNEPLMKQRQEAAEAARKAKEWEEQARANLQNARMTIGNVVAPTFSKAKQHVEKLGVPVQINAETQTLTPAAYFRWGKGARTSHGVQFHSFAIVGVNHGESLKAVVSILGKDPVETRVPEPVDPVWIEEEITAAIESTLLGG